MIDRSLFRASYFLLFIYLLFSSSDIRHVKNITSLINTTDIKVFNNDVIVATNGGIYRYNHQPQYQESIIDELDYTDISCMEVGPHDRLWLGTNYPNGIVQILDTNLNVLNTIDFVQFDQVLKIQIDENFAFALVENENLKSVVQYSNRDNVLLNSYLNIFNSFPDIYNNIHDILIIDTYLYIATDNGVFYSDFETDLLMLESSWTHIYENQNILKLFEYENTLHVVDDENIWSNNALIFNLAIDGIVKDVLVNENKIFLSTDSIVYKVENMNSIEVVFEKPDSMNTLIQNIELFDNAVYLGLKNQGIVIINNEIERFIPKTIFNNEFMALSIHNNRNLGGISKDGMFIYSDLFSIYNSGTINNFYASNKYLDNFYPVFSSDDYKGSVLPYISGAMDPNSFLIDDNSCYYPNSGLYPTYDNYIGYEDNILASLLQIDFNDNQIIDYWGSDIFTGLNGIYNPQWTTGYTVINQIQFDKYNNLWIINPYSEGDVNKPFLIKLENNNWVSIIDNQNISAYLPTEIAFDKYDNVWIAYQSENELYADSDISYSPGGLRVLDYNDINNENDDIWYNYPFSELLGINIWSIDIGKDQYNNDILWILSDLGVMGYLINIDYSYALLDIELVPINPYFYFTNVPFEQGCKIRVDNQNNAWILTENDGIKVIKNNGLLWPDNYGLTQENSKLLSSKINDIVFDDYGFVYVATAKGISVFETVFSLGENNDNLTFSPNPFIIDGFNTLDISNFQNGSTLQVINLSGKVLKEFKSNNQTSIFSWDGRDSENNLLNTGIYLVSAYHPTKGNKVGKFAVIRK